MMERVKTIALCALFSFFIKPVIAQPVFGVKGGVQLSRMTGVEGNPQGLLSSLQAKLVSIIPVGDETSITPSLGYSRKGYRWNGIEFTDQYGTPVGQGDVYGMFNYIQFSLPLSYKFAMDKTKDLYVGAGPYVAYAISGKGKVKNVAISSTDDHWDLFANDFYKRFDAGVVVEFTSTINRRFLASVNADIGLANINNGEGNKLKQIGAGLSIGYLFSATK